MDPINLGGALPSMDRLRLALSAPKAPSLPGEGSEARPGDLDFSQILRDALEPADSVHKIADDKVRRFMAGEEVPIHEIMASLAEADISVRLLTQVSSRVISAYQDIARLQV